MGENDWDPHFRLNILLLRARNEAEVVRNDSVDLPPAVTHCPITKGNTVAQFAAAFWMKKERETDESWLKDKNSFIFGEKVKNCTSAA